MLNWTFLGSINKVSGSLTEVSKHPYDLDSAGKDLASLAEKEQCVLPVNENDNFGFFVCLVC